MNNHNKWSRRKFCKAVISAQLLLASGLLTLPTGCVRDNKNKDQPLDDAMIETLKIAMDEIIPSNEKMPSASEIGSVDYVFEILEELPDLTTLFETLVAALEKQSIKKNKTSFPKLKREERIAVLKIIEHKQTELFNVLKDFTYESYYLNDTIYKLINYEPHPTGTAGPTMEPFDEKLLARVKKIPQIFRSYEK